VRRKRPSGEGEYAGLAGIIVRGGVCAWACAGVGTFVGKRRRLCGGVIAEVFVGRGLLSPVFTADERCSERPHICHLAKFERNRTVRGRVIAL